MSFAKTTSALPYMLTAQERKRKGLDLILLRGSSQEIITAGNGNVAFVDPRRKQFWYPGA
jgi:hypothetical protein